MVSAVAAVVEGGAAASEAPLALRPSLEPLRRISSLAPLRDNETAASGASGAVEGAVEGAAAEAEPFGELPSPPPPSVPKMRACQ